MAKNVKRIAIGTAIAAAAGYVTGLLTAPKSGKETRDDIKQNVSKGLSEAEKELKKLHTELASILTEAKASGDKLSGSAKKDLSSLLDKAKDTKEKAREMLSAIHEGDADDKDLQKAIKEANVAIDHIKTYLKK
jgi:gas vesicle protein